MFCFASSQLQAETKKFSTENRTNKFKPLRQENFCFLLRFARNETSLRGDKADEQKRGSVYKNIKFAQTRNLNFSYKSIKVKYLVMILNVTKKFLTEDRTYSSSREKISSSFKSAQETSLFKVFSSSLFRHATPLPSQTPAVQPLQASAFLALLRSRLAR